ncbi:MULTISPECIES: hypothetical protein [Heyndrickxia]|jgi:predicted membrane protein|uniref:hypothetical protein n=1 Tax=Heyndrickxia TaxID=2837504 RepID=UPI0003A4263C|nr:hypothetical protein [Heyndrickxia oleronia]OJH20026.1 transposase [Bacillus obstructivus]MCI1592304.1 transposase [Heyndrickxia oleronia]MCI1615205.1 transposase [Heyndrickxia oleronia]MCI1746016.1 transposase [Heyndrickxia oleronia]MCI1763287.1 transposase [Heyndrickxia oleronia]
MSFFIGIASVIVPIIMYILQHYWRMLRLLFNSIALLSFLIFGNIAAYSILNVIKDNTVFMTTIHSVFLNVYFLLTGAYIGVYILYQVLFLIFKERSNSKRFSPK